MHGAFRKATRSISLLAQRGVKVRLSSVIYEDNQWELDKLADLAIELGASCLNFTFVLGFGRGAAFKTQHTLDVSQDYHHYLFSFLEKYQDVIPLVTECVLNSDKLNCGAGTDRITIGADGSIRPCALFSKAINYGNVIKEPLNEVLARSRLQDFLRIPAPSEEHGCPRDCEYFFDCRRCFVRGFANGVTFCDAEPHYCAWIKENDLKGYAEEITVK